MESLSIAISVGQVGVRTTMRSLWWGCYLLYGTLIYATDHAAFSGPLLHAPNGIASCLRPASAACGREAVWSARRVGSTVRQCEPPGSSGFLQPDAYLSDAYLSDDDYDAVLSKDAVLSDDDDDMGGLAGGFSTSLAKGYARGDPRGSKMGTSLSAPSPPPPPPLDPAPRGFSKPSAADSKASFQVAAGAAASPAQALCPCCYATVPGNAAFCIKCGEKILLGGSTVRHWTIAQAEEFQYTNSQLGPSSCAPAAVMSSLNMIHCLPDNVSARISLMDGLMRLVRHRACACRHGAIAHDSQCPVSLQQYLLARGACGGGGSEAMINLVEDVCPDVVGGALNVGSSLPFKEGALLEWIARWMQDGAALTLTFNRQKVWDFQKSRGGHTKRLGGMPDAWHAQPILAVDLDKREVVFANPVKALTEMELQQTFPSDATLRVRGNEVLLHCQGVDNEKISQYNWPSQVWRDKGVSEQILLMRKHFAGDLWLQANKAFVTIPYSGTGEQVGPLLRLFAPRDSSAGRRLLAERDSVTFEIRV